VGSAEQFLKWFLNRRQVAPAKDRLDRRNHVGGFGYASLNPLIYISPFLHFS